jgi:hypothetical protein
VRIAPTDTTPLSDENAPDPARPSPPRKKAQAPKPHGALRVNVARRSPKDSDPESEEKPQRQTKAGAKTGSAPDSVDHSAPAVQEPGVEAAPKPVWGADGATEGPPRIPNWEHGYDTEVPDVPVHVAPLTRRRRRRSRVFVAAVVLLCLLFAFVAVAAILSSRHNPNAATVSPPGGTTSELTSSAVSRVQEATNAAATATTAARSKLAALPGIPTPTDVAAIVNPYVSALQSYETTLTGTDLPATARTTVGAVRSLVKQDVQFVSTIDGLPPLGLGTYLAEFGTRSTQLQTTLSETQRELRTATS